MKQEQIIYFAYGANLDITAMSLRCPGCRPLCTAILPDHKLVFRSVADVELAEGQSVHGALYQINQTHLNNLDRFEGYPNLYTRKTVTVTLEDDSTLDAVIYQMTDRNSYSPPSKFYLDIILSGIRIWGILESYSNKVLTAATDNNIGGN